MEKMHPISEKSMEIDSLLVQIEIALDKAKTMSADLDGEFFCYSETEKEPFVKGAYYEKAGIKNNITFDYIAESLEKLKEVRNCIFEKEKPSRNCSSQKALR